MEEPNSSSSSSGSVHNYAAGYEKEEYNVHLTSDGSSGHYDAGMIDPLMMVGAIGSMGVEPVPLPVPGKKKKKDKSIYKGVFRCGNKFKAQIQTNGVQHYLGLFDDEKEAARAYDAHARMVLGPRAKTNLEYKDGDSLPETKYPPSIQTVVAKKAIAQNIDPATVVGVGVGIGIGIGIGIGAGAGAPGGIMGGIPIPEKTGGVTKRVYVGIKARQKRPASTMGGSSSDGYRGGGKSLVEGMADAMHTGKRMRTGSSGSPTSGGHGMQSHLYHHMMHGSSSSGSGVSMNGIQTDYMIQNGHNQGYYDNDMGYGMGMSDDGGLQAEDDDYEPDWRDQIYYWTGLLSFDTANSCLLWKGSWLGSFTGKPNPEEFAWSTNEFEYSGEQLNLDDLYVQGLLRPKSGYFKGFYLMDNDGSGSLEKYLDNEYYVEFEEVRGLHPPRYTVIGKGESDFGTFVLTGTYNAGNRVLEMARQYIAEDDERCNMDINQLKLHLIAAAAGMT